METMKKKIKMLGLVIGMSVFLAAAGGCQKEQEEQVRQEETNETSQAPDFTVRLASGEEFTLSEQEGKVVLLNFWATWCGPCVEEMPALEKIHTEYGDQVQVIAVDCGEEQAVVDSFLEETGYTFPVAYDENNEASSRYPVTGIPYTVIIGKDGVVTQSFTGSMGAEAQYELYKEALEEALAQ